MQFGTFLHGSSAAPLILQDSLSLPKIVICLAVMLDLSSYPAFAVLRYFVEDFSNMVEHGAPAVRSGKPLPHHEACICAVADLFRTFFTRRPHYLEYACYKH